MELQEVYITLHRCARDIQGGRWTEITVPREDMPMGHWAHWQHFGTDILQECHTSQLKLPRNPGIPAVDVEITTNHDLLCAPSAFMVIHDLVQCVSDFPLLMPALRPFSPETFNEIIGQIGVNRRDLARAISRLEREYGLLSPEDETGDGDASDIPDSVPDLEPESTGLMTNSEPSSANGSVWDNQCETLKRRWLRAIKQKGRRIPLLKFITDDLVNLKQKSPDTWLERWKPRRFYDKFLGNRDCWETDHERALAAPPD